MHPAGGLPRLIERIVHEVHRVEGRIHLHLLDRQERFVHQFHVAFAHQRQVVVERAAVGPAVDTAGARRQHGYGGDVLRLVVREEVERSALVRSPFVERREAHLPEQVFARTVLQGLAGSQDHGAGYALADVLRPDGAGAQAAEHLQEGKLGRKRILLGKHDEKDLVLFLLGQVGSQGQGAGILAEKDVPVFSGRTMEAQPQPACEATGEEMDRQDGCRPDGAEEQAVEQHQVGLHEAYSLGRRGGLDIVVRRESQRRKGAEEEQVERRDHGQAETGKPVPDADRTESVPVKQRRQNGDYQRGNPQQRGFAADDPQGHDHIEDYPAQHQEGQQGRIIEKRSHFLVQVNSFKVRIFM